MTLDDLTPVTRLPRTRRRQLFNVLAVLAFCVALGALSLPKVARVREPAARMNDMNNLKQLMLAEHIRADTLDNAFIGPFAADRQGVPNTGLSFRVSLLPYLEQENVYRLIDLQQPWDSAQNAPATSCVIKVFQSPVTPDRTKPDTPYRVFYGGGALFEADGAPVKLKEVPDGTSNTILCVHATEAVPWAKPQEFPYARTTPLPPLGSKGMSRGFNVAFADGSVRFVRDTIAEADLRSLIEKADGRGAGVE